MSESHMRNRDVWMMLLSVLALASAYILTALAYERHCGPNRAAVVGLLGPECVWRGSSR